MPERKCLLNIMMADKATHRVTDVERLKFIFKEFTVVIFISPFEKSRNVSGKNAESRDRRVANVFMTRVTAIAGEGDIACVMLVYRNVCKSSNIWVIVEFHALLYAGQLNR